MKIRTDFVTNSSSSSFILARKSTLSEKQKELIIKYVEDTLLGEKLISPDDSEEKISTVIKDYYRLEDEEEIKKALSEGKSIYGGYVIYEECEYYLASIYENLWKILEENSDGDFTSIDNDLSY